jgi:alpha-ribazole phosphatase/probable phosphoglycerate mutase
MNTLLFIRHAETDMAGRFCGHADPPVNERGQRQIEELLKSLEGEPIDAVYTSDLSRALTTANAVGQAFRLSPVVVPGLREIYFGDWEGLSWEEIETRDPAYARRWSESYPLLPAPGGESFEAFKSRVMAEVECLLAMPEPRCVAVVTHGGVMRVVLRTLCAVDETEAWERTKTYCGFFRYPQKGRSR